MRHWIARRLNASIERCVPERRIYVRSDRGTRFVRLSSAGQVLIGTGVVALLGWTVLGTAVLMSGAAGPVRSDEAERRDQAAFEARLDALASARDAHALEAEAADRRYAAALDRMGSMQEALLAAEGRLIEADTGLEAVQETMRRVIGERDLARRELAALTGEGDVESATLALGDAHGTVELLSAALGETARERDALAGAVADREAQMARLELDARLTAERNDRIFAQLEEAVSVSLEPLERMFSAAGLPTDDILAAVRSGHDGQGGPLEAVATIPGDPVAQADARRANAILGALGEMKLYRAAADTLPFADPVPSGAYRLTSGFGPRRDPMGRGTRMHSGVDFAGARGTPIHTTADGVVTRAGWMRGYGKTIEVTHAFGIMTRYAHLSSIDVQHGQRLSRGDRIGGMGTTGRSTGVHLHYEVHANGSPVNPMTYIKAARDVF